MDMDDLFGANEPRRRLAREQANQRSMEAANKAKQTKEAKRLAKEGMDRVEASTDRAIPGWGAAAYAKLCDFARIRTIFTGEECKRWAYAQGLDKPPKEAAWGPVFAKAARQRVTQFKGYVVASSASRHSAPNRQWISLVFDGGTNG